MTIEPKKCKAITRQGRPCRNNAMEKSDYCYIHSLGHIKRVPAWKNLTFHLLTIILAVLGTVIPLFYTIYFGPTKDIQQKIINKGNETYDLVLKMVRIEKTDFIRLIKKYPLGYVLFAIDPKKNIIPTIPTKSLLKEAYDIDWDKASILEITDDGIDILLPDFIPTKPPFNMAQGKLIECRCVIKRKLGVAKRSIAIKVKENPLSKTFVVMYWELLADDPQGIIGLIGFRERIQVKE